ncbi:lipoprotein [Mycoplasma yeatsii]|uniref:lipoprotein n=1 Tax=Mycoplasma yeatsii TaxID=51365 RepID=UPI0005B2519F|nr:lipoprotein [Mycoplasma yeatsii]AJM71903.1 lipoprotein [Mycoplasma yeatsii GM274B]
MKKLLTILGSVAMVATTGAVAVACKTEAKDSVKDLSKEIKVTEISLPKADWEKTDKIIEAVNKANEGLNLTDKDVEVAVNEAKDGAKIKAKADNKKFKGEKDVKFKDSTPAPAKKKLSDLIKNLDLGEIAKEDDILAKVIEKNSQTVGELKVTDLVKSESKPADNGNKKVTISVKEESQSKFEGTVDVTFKLKASESATNPSGGNGTDTVTPPVTR